MPPRTISLDDLGQALLKKVPKGATIALSDLDLPGRIQNSANIIGTIGSQSARGALGLGQLALSGAEFIRPESVLPERSLLQAGSRTLGRGIAGTQEFLTSITPDREEGFAARISENLGAGTPLALALAPFTGGASIPAILGFEALSAVGGGVAEESARRSGAGDLAQTLAGIAGSIASPIGVTGLAGLATKKGLFGLGTKGPITASREVIDPILQGRAKESVSTLLREAAEKTGLSPDEIGSELQQAILRAESESTGLAKLDSPAELLLRESDNVSEGGVLLSAVEKAAKLSSSSGSDALARTSKISLRITKRQAKRKEVLNNILPEANLADLNPGALGASIRKTLIDLESGIDQEIAAAFKPIAKKTPVILSKPAIEKVLIRIDNILPAGRRTALSSTVNMHIARLSGLLPKPTKLPIPETKLGVIQQFRSQALQTKRDILSRNGNKSNIDTLLLSTISDGYDELLNSGIELGSLSVEQVAQLKLARRLRANKASLFPQKSIPTKLLSSEEGIEVVKDESILDLITRDNTNLTQTLKTLTKSDFPEVHAKLRRFMINKAIGSANVNDVITPAKFQKLVRDKKAVFKQLFTSNELTNLSEIQKSLFSESRVQQIGKSVTPGETTTAVNTSIIKSIANVAKGVTRTVSPRGAGPIDKTLRFISDTIAGSVSSVPRDERFKQLLFEASMNPQIMVDMLKRPTGKNLDRIASRILSHFLDSNKEFLAGVSSGVVGSLAEPGGGRVTFPSQQRSLANVPRRRHIKFPADSITSLHSALAGSPEL